MKLRYLKPFALSILLGQAQELSYSIIGEWASKYVEQGYETSEDSCYSTTLLANWDKFEFMGLYRYVPNQDFQELNLGLHHTLELNSYSLSYGYIYYHFPAGVSHGHELDATLSFNGVDLIAPYLTLLYDLQQNSFYLESGISYSYEANEFLSLSPYVLMGFDFNYATPDFDGGAQIQVGVQGIYSLPQDLSLIFSYNRSFALEDLKVNGQGDLNWVTCGFSKSF